MISPYVRRLRLAGELRKLRADAGLSQEQLAKLIGKKNRNQIVKLENAQASPDPDDILKLLEVLQVDDDRWTLIYTMATEASQRSWWESNSHAMGARQTLTADLEAGAVTIREYQQTFPPGLLQTEEYARSRYESAATLQPPDAGLDKVVAGRAGRQRMMRRPGGPTYEVILDEMVVRRLTAPPGVVKQQLYHMAAEANREPKIIVRVLPAEAVVADYTVPRSTYSVYTYPDSGDPTVVAVDTVTSDLVLTELGEVRPYEELYNRLHDAALSPADSLELLTAAAAALPSHP